MADVIYTGKGLSTKLPSDGGQAMGRLSDFIVKSEEIKYNAFKENEKEYLKASNIDPAFFISASNQKAQGKLLDEFNQKWSQRWKQGGANMSTDEKVQMQVEKNFIISQQQKMQADMARALQDRDIISKDIAGNIDREDADKRWNDYISSGTYDTTPLKPSAIDPDTYLSKRTNKGIGTKGTVTVTTNKDGKVYTEKRVASATEDEAREMIEADMVSNPRLAMGYIKKFQALKTTDPETYVKYLDTNNDGKVDASEEQATGSTSNPIVKWAQDNYWQKRIDIQEAETTKPSEGRNTSFNWNLGIGSGNNRNTQFSKNNDIKLQQLPVYKTFYDLQLGSVPAVIQKVQDFIDSNTGERKILNQAVNMKIVGYSPENDRLIVNVEDDVRPAKGSSVGIRKDTKIELDASLYDALLRSKPYGFSRDKAIEEAGVKEGQGTIQQSETPAERMRRIKGQQ